MSARIRTGYSFRNAVGHIKEVADRCKEIGLTHAPITDRSSAFGYVRWSKVCKELDLVPVFGVEIAVTNSVNAKKPTFDPWTFIPTKTLSTASKLIWDSGNQFRYRPLLTYEQAIETKDCVKIVGSRSPIDEVPRNDDIYISLSPSTPRGYYRKAKELGHKFIACSDNRFTNQGDVGLYETIAGRMSETQSYKQHILSDEEWRSAVAFADDADIEAALVARDEVLKSGVHDLIQAELLHPDHELDLREMCEKGAEEIGVDLSDPEYAARLDKELGLIYEKNFEDYFYIIADICQYARANMVVGPARGSSCGSLVCYLLKITTVDPIKYGLIFERFIDINRNDLPDIDIDFSDIKRHMVFRYMEQKYGRERVARLGTVSLYKPRSCLQEAASALDIPPWHITPILDAILDRSTGDARALQATEDTLKETAAGRELISKYPEMSISGRMEGHPRHSSQHAAGIVLTNSPVQEYIPVDPRTNATHCDKYDADDLGLLKIDALGLTQLSIFEDALELAGLPLDFLDTLSTDDPEAFKVLQDRKFSGIFQFNGLALQSVASSIKIENFEDIVSVTALARPGPLATGGTNQWIDVKNGKKQATYAHPVFKPYLENTLGVVTYQEQVMNIGREVGDLSWDDVSALRKAMSKSLGKEFFDKFGDPWKKAAIAKGVPEDVAFQFWEDMCSYGSWAFNRSHAVAYGLISYWCCWMKAHYPLEFAAATLSHSGSVEEQILVLREMKDEGIDYVPFDPDVSTDKWTVAERDGKKVLVGPLQNIIGLGPKGVQSIMSARARGETIPESTQKKIANGRTKIDSLYPIGARFRQLMPNPAERNIHTAPTKVIDCQPNGLPNQEVLVFACISHIRPRDENDQQNIAKRGYAFKGPTQALNLRVTDDTDTIFAKVDRWKYEKVGRPIVERGRAGKALYAIKGTIPTDFRMIKVNQIRYIGDMERDTEDDQKPE
jgi:DNA polymerase III alpha subunit